MNKHLYILMAALAIAPGIAHGAAAPVVAPVNPNMVVLPQLQNPTEQAASQYLLMRALSCARNAVCPRVNLPTILNNTQVDKTTVNLALLTEEVHKNVGAQIYIRNATMNKSRSLRMAAFASLLGIAGMGTYALCNGMSACTVNNGLAATAALCGIFGLTRFAVPRINNMWNQRVVSAHQNAIKKSELLTETIAAGFGDGDASLKATVAAMTFKPVVAGQGITARIRSLFSHVSLPAFKIPFRRAESVTTAAPVVAPDVAPVVAPVANS